MKKKKTVNTEATSSLMEPWFENACSFTQRLWIFRSIIEVIFNIINFDNLLCESHISKTALFQTKYSLNSRKTAKREEG